MTTEQPYSHIIFLTGLLPGLDKKPMLSGRLQDETFQTLVTRMLRLGWECSALQFRLRMENESFDAVAGDDEEVESAKRRFTDIMLTRDNGVSRSVCWIYVTARADKRGGACCECCERFCLDQLRNGEHKSNISN